MLLILDAMASSSSLTTIPLHEPVFQQFFHDVHHAYLLHRAMSLLPPTLIPNIEPTPLPSTGVWNQPPGLLPDLDYSDETMPLSMVRLSPHPTSKRKRHSCRSLWTTTYPRLTNMSMPQSQPRSLLRQNSLRNHLLHRRSE